MIVKYCGSEWTVTRDNGDGTFEIEQWRRYSDGDSIAVGTVRWSEVKVVK